MQSTQKRQSPRVQKLRRLHALGRERGFTHERLRSIVGVPSLAKATPAQLHAACKELAQLPPHKGGQAGPAGVSGICAICFHVALTSPCAKCRLQERALTPQPKLPQWAKELDLGPIAEPSKPARMLTPTTIDNKLIIALLKDCETSWDLAEDAQRHDWAGELTEQERQGLVRWMRRHGAIQPSQALPAYWAIQNPAMTLTINTTRTGRSFITLIDYNIEQQPPPKRNYDHSSLVLEGGAA